MIELVFVIVILGILASLAMGRMDRDLKQEASETILSHIRLAQQLALTDNKHLPDNNVNRDKWQTAYWQFAFKKCGDDVAYRVASDGDFGGGINGIGDKEAAINPIDGKYIYSKDCSNLKNDETPSVLLSKKFGIKNSGISTDGGCKAHRQILFDYMGRPHSGNTSYKSNPNFVNIMTKDCNMTFTMSDGDTFSIIIEHETGYAYIEGEENS